MCIAVPMRIVEADGLMATARREGVPDLRVDTSLVGELAPATGCSSFARASSAP